MERDAQVFGSGFIYGRKLTNLVVVNGLSFKFLVGESENSTKHKSQVFMKMTSFC